MAEEDWSLLGVCTELRQLGRVFFIVVSAALHTHFDLRSARKARPFCCRTGAQSKETHIMGRNLSTHGVGFCTLR